MAWGFTSGLNYVESQRPQAFILAVLSHASVEQAACSLLRVSRLRACVLFACLCVVSLCVLSFLCSGCCVSLVSVCICNFSVSYLSVHTSLINGFIEIQSTYHANHPLNVYS